MRAKRWQKQLLYFATLLLGGLAFAGCWSASRKPTAQPAEAASTYTLDTFIAYPDYVPPPRPPIEDNPITPQKIALGKKLFYDPTLSGDNSQRCASCHRPEAAFSDAGRARSVGIEGQETARNAPGLFNLAWHPRFFWDGGVGSLETQALGPLLEETEMHQPLRALVHELNQRPEYRRLFAEAFDDDSLRSKYIVYALAQFERTLVSFGSTYDRWRQGAGELGRVALRGHQLFTTPIAEGGAGCAACHAPPLFSDFSYRNNGLEDWKTITAPEGDPGRGRITTQRADSGRFKVPSLRNVARTPPYMHDGRYATLEKAVAHYAEEVHASPTLDSALTPYASGKHTLSAREQQALVAFLRTLSDPGLARNKAYLPE